MTPRHYSTSAIVLHWAIALALAFQLALGWRLESFARGPGQFAAFQLHKSVGIAVLLLTLARVAIRFAHPRPVPLADSRWAELAAKVTHFALYALMLIGPLSGWALVSSAKLKVPTLLFGAIPWPHLPLGKAWNHLAHEAHEITSFLFVALIGLHVAGAIRHQFVRGEALLERIIPTLKPASALVAAIGLMGLAAGASLALSDAPEATRSDRQVVGPSPAETSDPAAAAHVATQSGDDTLSEAASAQPLSAWLIAPGGHLSFSASWNGSAVEGAFRKWTADIAFSPGDLAASAVTVKVDLASVDTADAQRDEMLRGADFFDTGAHPAATFKARGFRALGGDRYEAKGMLDLHGRSRPVALRFTLRLNGDAASVSGSARIDRTAFGVGSGDYAGTEEIAAEIAIDFALTARRSE